MSALFGGRGDVFWYLGLLPNGGMGSSALFRVAEGRCGCFLRAPSKFQVSGSMARPPTPLSQITPASAEHNKGRLEDRLKKLTTTTVGKLGNPSRWMTKDQQRIWKQLVKAAPGMLGENDRPLMEITCVLKQKLESQNIENAQITQLINCLQKLGMIPAERAPVSQKVLEDANPWDRFKKPTS